MAKQKRSLSTSPAPYVWRRPETSVLWFRMGVPRKLQTKLGKTMIAHGLGTANVHEASIRAAQRRVELLTEWGMVPTEAPRSPVERIIPSEADMKAAVAQRAFTRVLERLDALIASKGFETESEHLQALAVLESQLLKHGRGAGPDWSMMADILIETNGWHLPKGCKGHGDLVTMLAEAGSEALQVGIRRHKGELSAEPTSRTVKEGLAIRHEKAPAGQSLLELFDLYAKRCAAEERKRADTLAQDRKVIERFSEFVGASRQVRSIKREEVRDWRNTLESLPPTYRNMKAYAGLTLRQAAEKARGNKVGLKPVTINKYLSTVSPFLSWCVREGYSDQNPCDGLFYVINKAANARPPFTPDQLTKLFASPLFIGFERDGKEHKPGRLRTRDWRYWLPILMLFTGARIGEIAQLSLGDVEEVDGTWVINIRHDRKTGQTTKSKVSRFIPIHPQLGALGFIEFVRGQKEKAGKGKDLQLWPELKRNGRDQWAAPSRFIRDYLKRIGLKTGRDGMGPHSFRHTMADRLREAGYLDHEIAIVLGHSNKTVTSGYGRQRHGTIEMMKSMLDKVCFYDVDLQHLCQ